MVCKMISNFVCLGISNDQLAGRATSVDACDPKSKEDFDRFAELLQEKITKYEVSLFYHME